jgi:hypothetical protein
VISDAHLWNLAGARIRGFVINIPQWAHQAHVEEYHQILADFQNSCTSDFSAFKIPESAMSLTHHRPPSFFELGMEGYKYCDPTIFRTKVFGLVNYAASIVKEDQPRPLPGAKKPADPKAPPSSIYIGTMQGSQIVQNSSNTSLTNTYDPKSSEFKELVRAIKVAIPKLNLEPGKTNQLHVDIGTVEVQIGAPNPKRSIITESMHSIRNIVEGAIGSAVASGLLPAIYQYFPK